MNIYIYTTFTYISTSFIWLSGNARCRSWRLVHVGALEVPKQLKLMWMLWSTRAILGSAWRKSKWLSRSSMHTQYTGTFTYTCLLIRNMLSKIFAYVKSLSLHRFTCCILKQKVVVATWPWTMEAADAPLENPAPGHSVGNPNTATKPNLFETHSPALFE